MKVRAVKQNAEVVGSNLSTALRGLPGDTWNAVKDVFSKDKPLREIKDLPHPIKTPLLAQPTKQSMKLGFNIVKQPFTYAAGLAIKGMDGLARGIKGHPLLASTAIIGGVAYGIQRWRHGSAEEQTARAFNEQVAQINAIQQQAQMQGPVANTYNYHNSVTPEESAAMEAKLAAKRDQAGGMAAGMKQQAASATAEL